MVVAGALSKMSDVAAAGSKLAQGSGATAMSYAKAAPSSPQALDSSSSRDSKIIDDLQATIDSLNAKLVATARAASDDKAKITALENEVSKLNDKLAVARGEVAALQKRPAAAASAPAATEAATARSSKTDNYEKLYLAAMKSLQVRACPLSVSGNERSRCSLALCRANCAVISESGLFRSPAHVCP